MTVIEDEIEVRLPDGWDATSIAIRGRRADSPSGRSVLLLHGMANSSAVWTPVLPLLPPEVDIWHVDLPWRGDGPPGWKQHDQAVDWVSAVLDAVPGGADVVVGHSYAATLLLTLFAGEAAGMGAGRRPSRLVLVSPFYRRTQEEFEWNALENLLTRFQSTIADGIRMHSTHSLDEGMCAAIAQKVSAQIGPYGWLRFFELYLGTPELRPDLIDLDCEIVVGADDSTAPAAEGRALAGLLPGAGLHDLAGCGHFPMIERPDDFARIITELIEQSDGQRQSAEIGRLTSGA